MNTMIEQVRKHLEFFDQPGCEHRLNIAWEYLGEPIATRREDGKYDVVWAYPTGDTVRSEGVEYDEITDTVVSFGGLTTPGINPFMFAMRPAR
jgi:hypothetical protein